MDIEEINAPELIRWGWAETGGSLAIVTSFQAEGMVLLDMASRVCPQARVVTVDTGRLPEETHQMIEQVRERYGVRIEVVLPDPVEIESMVARHGPNLFYRDVPARMLCCHLRKVRPLERKLASFRAWVTGVRRDQNGTRGGTRKVSVVDGRLKLCPLADWSSTEVHDYIRRNNVPLHPLYGRGYRSIGCEPCTRAVEPHEHERAGRWWWEAEGFKECGLHFNADGQTQRTVDVLIDDVLRAPAA